MIKDLERDGWRLDRRRRAPPIPSPGTSTVTAPGNLGDDLAPGTLGSIRRQAGWRSGYAVVIEQADGNLSAYVPDLPGCVATGSTEREVRSNIAEAIRLHVVSLRTHGEPVPPPTSSTVSVEVA